jgi:hypothetical protein
MTTVVPQSELTRRAIAWINEQCACHAEQAEARLYFDEAAARFNLSPLEVEFLERFFAGGAKGEQES